MVKKRGRPPKYDADAALDGALEVFWRKGFASTSLDDLAAAMNMNRPSIYNAFGDKEAIYRKAYERFVKRVESKVESIFHEPELKPSLQALFSAVMDIYYSSDAPLGCFSNCTAPVEAATSEVIRNDLNKVIAHIDGVIEKRLIQAKDQGWQPRKDVKVLAQMLHSMLQSMSIRARSGESRKVLDRLALDAIDIICED